MQSKARTVAEYLESLPPDRRAAMEAVRAVILKNLGKGYEEGMQYGMIGYCGVPLQRLPHAVYYHCDPRQPVTYAGLASHKNHMAIYLMCVYGSKDQAQWFRDEWAKSGKKLDMFKSCIRFKKIDDVALDAVGKAIAKVPMKKYIEHYEAALLALGKNKTSDEDEAGVARGGETRRRGDKETR